MTKRNIIIAGIALAIVAFVAFFFPKNSGRGGSAIGVTNTTCQCFGYETRWVAVGPWESTCYGIPYSCVSENGFETSNKASGSDDDEQQPTTVQTDETFFTDYDKRIEDTILTYAAKTVPALLGKRYPVAKSFFENADEDQVKDVLAKSCQVFQKYVISDYNSSFDHEQLRSLPLCLDVDVACIQSAQRSCSDFILVEYDPYLLKAGMISFDKDSCQPFRGQSVLGRVGCYSERDYEDGGQCDLNTMRQQLKASGGTIPRVVVDTGIELKTYSASNETTMSQMNATHTPIDLTVYERRDPPSWQNVCDTLSIIKMTSAENADLYSRADPDQDGLMDSVEISLGLNPHDKDTDHDGFTDREELVHGYNPNGSGVYIDTNLIREDIGTCMLASDLDTAQSEFNTVDGFDTLHSQIKYECPGNQNVTVNVSRFYPFDQTVLDTMIAKEFSSSSIYQTNVYFGREGYIWARNDTYFLITGVQDRGNAATMEVLTRYLKMFPPNRSVVTRSN